MNCNLRRLAWSAVILLAATAHSADFVTGSVPPNDTAGAAALKTELGLVRIGSKLVLGLGRCGFQAVQKMYKGAAFDSVAYDTCKTAGKTSFTTVAADKKPAAPSCLQAKDETAAAGDLENILERAAGLIACEGSTPLPGNLSGTLPSTLQAAAAEKAVLKNTRKLAARIARCRKKRMIALRKGQVFDTACESTAQGKFDAANAALTGVPPCLADNLASIRDELSLALASKNEEVFCQGSAPVQAGGCCQLVEGCAIAADETECTGMGGTSFQDGTACNLDGLCQPSTCLFPSTCDEGETPENCPADCDPCEPGQTYEPVTHACLLDQGKLVFLTNSPISAAFGGIAGGDFLCQSAPLYPGTFKAWISDSTQSPATTFTHAAGPYYKLVLDVNAGLRRPVIVANDWADLTDRTLASPIDTDQNADQWANYFVWTGTDADGASLGLGGICDGWTTASPNVSAYEGNTSRTDSGWSAATATSCDDTSSRLYCFEQ